MNQTTSITDPYMGVTVGDPPREKARPVFNQTNELAAALATAQGAMENAKLNRENPHFKSKYADLAAIRDATIPALSKNGLSICQYTEINDHGLVLITRLQHTSGQFLESRWPLTIDKPQQMGSALTYAKRYCWSSMVGISADEDDDGNVAQDTSKPKGTAYRSADDPDWKGPLNKTQLKAAVRELDRDLESITDAEQYITVCNNHYDTIQQVKNETKFGGWDDNEDGHGLRHRLEEKGRECKADGSFIKRVVT